MISKTMHTPNEKWCGAIDQRYSGTWYDLCSRFAAQSLSNANNKGKLLIVGSPLAEAQMHRIEGWEDITYCDVRKPPNIDFWVKGDVVALPFEPESFDAASSACVMTHAGLGRYGDRVCDHGDEAGMREIFRVLKRDTLFACTYGAVIDADKYIVWGTTHRVYTPKRARELAEGAGFEILDERVYRPKEKRWLVEAEACSTDPNAHDYITHLLRKP